MNTSLITLRSGMAWTVLGVLTCWTPLINGQTPAASDGVLEGHVGPVRMGVFTRDGQRAVTVSGDETVRLWDLASGREVLRHENHTGPLFCVSISGDGSTMVTGAQDRTLRLFDVPQPGPVHSLAGHKAPATALAISADGRSLVTGGEDNLVQLWSLNPTTGEINPRAAARAGHTSDIVAAAWRFDNQAFATGDASGEVRVWSPWLADPQATLIAHDGPIRGLAYRTSNQQLISAGADGVHRYWQLPLPSPRDLEFKTAVRDIGLPAYQDFAILGFADGTAQAYNIADGSIIGGLPRADAAVTALTVLSNATLAAVADEGGTTRIINLADRSVKGSVTQSGAVRDVVFAPDNRRVATAGSDGRVRLWTLSTPPTPVEGAGGLIAAQAQSIAFSRDGGELFAGGTDGKLRIFQLTDGSLTRTFDGHTGAITELAPTSDGKFLLSISADKSLRQWDLTDGTLVRAIPHPAPLRSLSIRSDNQRVAVTSTDGSVFVHDLSSGILLQRFTRSDAGGRVARWLRDGTTLVVGDENPGGQILRTSILFAFGSDDQPTRCMSPWSGGSQALMCSASGVVTLHDVTNGRIVRTFQEAPSDSRVMAPRADSQRIAAGRADGSIAVWTGSNGQTVQTLKVPAAVRALAWSPDNRKLAVVDADSRLSVFGPVIPPQRALPGEELVLHHQAASPVPVTQIVFSTDNRTLWSTRGDGTLAQWRYASPTQLRQFTHGGDVYGAALTRDGRILVSCSADQTISVWETATGRRSAQLRGHRGAVLAIALTPDESMVVSAGADRTIRLWDLAAGRQLKQLARHEETIYSVTVHPNGRLAAAAGADRRIFLFDLLSGQVKHTLEGHTDYVNCVSFSPNGNRLLSYGYAAQLKVWDPTSGSLLFEERVGQIGNYASYSPDGTRVLLSNGDTMARVFTLPQSAR